MIDFAVVVVLSTGLGLGSILYRLSAFSRSYYRGLTCQAQGRYGVALQYFDQALSQKPDFADAYYSRGNAKFELSDFSAAIQDYTHALSLRGDFAEAYYNRGNTYACLAQWSSAIHDYTATIALKPDFAPAYANRGWVYQLLEDVEKARQDFQNANRLFLQQKDHIKLAILKKEIRKIDPTMQKRLLGQGSSFLVTL